MQSCTFQIFMVRNESNPTHQTSREQRPPRDSEGGRVVWWGESWRRNGKIQASLQFPEHAHMYVCVFMHVCMHACV